MSADYQVRWTLAAERDLTEIIEYIMQNSPATAREIFNKVKAKTESLTLLPDRGGIIPELLSQGISLYREIIIAPWRVIYRLHQCFHIFAYTGTNRAMSARIRSNKGIPVIIAF